MGVFVYYIAFKAALQLKTQKSPYQPGFQNFDLQIHMYPSFDIVSLVYLFSRYNYFAGFIFAVFISEAFKSFFSQWIIFAANFIYFPSKWYKNDDKYVTFTVFSFFIFWWKWPNHLRKDYKKDFSFYLQHIFEGSWVLRNFFNQIYSP